jgi:decaprenyl-diphosphate synthase subunit 2
VQHLSTLDRSYDFQKNTKKLANEWKSILCTAEKVVGYPTSFLNLRYIISDEVANFASLLRRLLVTNHPLINTAKSIINEPNKYTQLIGLTVLLVSKAAGVSPKTHMASDLSEGIHQSQRALAEISEMINLAFIIHRGIVDLNSVEKNQYDDINNGNKIAVLCGDFLLAKACVNLAKLRNTQVCTTILKRIQAYFLPAKLSVKLR